MNLRFYKSEFTKTIREDLEALASELIKIESESEHLEGKELELTNARVLTIKFSFEEIVANTYLKDPDCMLYGSFLDEFRTAKKSPNFETSTECKKLLLMKKLIRRGKRKSFDQPSSIEFPEME